MFDVDGTLVDHDRAQRLGLLAHLADLGEQLDDARWARWRALEEHHFARYLSRDLTFQEQRRERVRGFTGETLDDVEADAWFDAYRLRFEQSWQVFDDVVDTLDQLAHLPLAAFSNVSGEYTRHKLTALGLIDRFVLAWGTDDIGAAKPDPRTFTGLVAGLGLAAADVLHVGDRYQPDGLGPCLAGLRGAWLDRPGAEPAGRVPEAAPDPRVAVITSLRDVVPLATGTPAARAAAPPAP